MEKVKWGACKKLFTIFSTILFLTSSAVFAGEADVLNEAGVKLAEQGELDQALIKFREAVDKDPKHAKAQFNLGEAAFELKQWDAAWHAYESYLALDKGTEEEKNGLIKKLVILRKDHGAQPPASTMALINSAKKDRDQKNFDSAEKSLKSAQSASPWVLEGTQELALLHAYKGDEKKAFEQVDLFSKYAPTSSDTESLRSNVNRILEQKKTASESKEKADRAQSEAEGFMKHGGFSVSGLMGYSVLGNTASDDGAKRVTYKELFSGSSGLDANVFFANPDRFWFFRIGYVYEKLQAVDNKTVTVTPGNTVGNVEVKPTDVTMNTVYLGLGLKGEYFYAVLDAGFTQLSSAELPSKISTTGDPIPYAPTNTGPIMYGAASVGAHLPVSAYFSLSLEARMGGPVGRAFYHRGPDTTANSVPLAEWISTNKLLAGLIYRF